MSIACPECGGEDLDANAVEAWCHDCDRRWDSPDPFYDQVRAIPRASEADVRAVAEARRMAPIELRARREALGLNQRQLAALLGAKQNTMSQWEAGKRAIPTGVVAEVERLELLADDLIEAAVYALDDAPALVTYATDADVPGGAFPASLHRVAMARALSEVGHVVPIVEAEK